MIDTILDFSIDHAEAFIVIFMVTVVSIVGGGIWAYGAITSGRPGGVAD